MFQKEHHGRFVIGDHKPEHCRKREYMIYSNVLDLNTVCISDFSKESVSMHLLSMQALESGNFLESNQTKNILHGA